MKTYFIITGLITLVVIIGWLYQMITTKPKFNNGRNRFAKNWNEGGKIVLILYLTLSVICSIIITIIVGILKSLNN